MSEAARNGHLEVVRFLIDNRIEAEAGSGVRSAASAGHLEILKYLRARGAPMELKGVLAGAAQEGRLDVVRWLLEDAHAQEKPPKPPRRGSRWGEVSPIEWAASNGHLEVVKYLFETGHHGYLDYAVRGAASSNHKAVVRWLLEHERYDSLASEWTREPRPTRTRSYISQATKNVAHAVSSAARMGHLDLAKYLYQHLEVRRRCANPNTTAYFREKLGDGVASATLSGHLAVVKWLVRTEFSAADAAGVLVDALRYAVSHGRGSVVRWIWSHPVLPSWARKVQKFRLADGAEATVKRSDFAMADWISDRLDDPMPALEAAARAGDVEMMQWLVGERQEGGETTGWVLTERERADLASCASSYHAWCAHKWLTSVATVEPE